MEIKVVAGTKLGHVPTKNELDRIGGLAAGVCYLPDTIDKLFDEAPEKTEKRKNMILASGHHSPFDHPTLVLQFDNIPKIVAMYLNNEKFYTTSEKSARYKRMPLLPDEQVKYDKWLEIYKELIRDTYQAKYPERFTELKITKLAQENSRYLTSVFTPTSMLYECSYRQINVLYGMMTKEIETLTKILDESGDVFIERLRAELVLCKVELEKTGYVDGNLSDNRKDRDLSLFRRKNYPFLKQFGEVYSISYLGSYAQLAQAHRHRTLSYQMELLDKPEFFVPPILKKDEGLVKEWLADCESLAEHFPQGLLVEIYEQGKFDDFVLKMKERNCADAQLEIDNQTTATKREMYENLKETNPALAEELKPYMKGSRCTFPDYKCATPCGFRDGVTGERLI